jgi:drug/metabolite transporter (DMT)-like permease
MVAFAGVVAMGMDPSAWTSSSSIMSSIQLGFTRGDALIVAAASLYTLHVVRLGYWARRTPPLWLATAKSAVQATFSLCFVGFLWYYYSTISSSFAISDSAVHLDLESLASVSQGLSALALSAGKEIATFFGTFASKLSSGQILPSSLVKLAGTVLWCGTVGNAYVLYAQSYGQRSVKPSDANLLYSLQPIFTALFAYLFLGETMDASGLVGGALILSAVYLVASGTLWSRRRRDSFG